MTTENKMHIYKYVTAERIDIFTNELIRFTQPSSFNDPFDTYPYFKAIAKEDQIEEFLKSPKWTNKEIEIKLKEKWDERQKNLPIKIPFDLIKNQMLEAAPIMKGWTREFMSMKSHLFRKVTLNWLVQGIEQTVGILCLTEKPDNLLMWSHYAKSHTGFVIEFDKDNKFFDQRKESRGLSGYLRKVTYSQNRPEIILLDQEKYENNLEALMNEVFWVKSKDWEYEQEWRMIEIFDGCKNITVSGQDKIYLFPLPIEAIKSIILGYRLKKDDEDKIVNLLKNNGKYSHVKLYKAEIHETEYKMNILKY